MTKEFKINPGAIHRLLQLTPFSWLGTVRRSLPSKPGKFLLDVGSGFGFPVSVLKPSIEFSVGVDVFEPYLRRCKANRLHDDHVLCDVRHLPFRPSSFDVIICLELIEHLSRSDGELLLSALESLRTSALVISSPVGYQHQDAADGNKYMAHQSSWGFDDFRSRGFQIRSRGLRIGAFSHCTKFSMPTLVGAIANYGLGFMGAIFPSMAVQLIAYKLPRDQASQLDSD